MAPRVRFAPSPTGYLHLGGARTALFNWLLARRLGGSFVLRIEDTDVERSSADMVEGILDGLRWLGLDWDEGPLIGGAHGPYFQSERLERYRAFAERLVAGGSAYYCYCTPEELKAKREAAQAPNEHDAVTSTAGTAWKYDRTCLRLSAAEIAARERNRVPRAIRFRVPDDATGFVDLVHGAIAFEGANIEDFVILRSDGHPTYHLSVVSDDLDMGITHVVRGDDHISNTPKQIMLYRAVGVEPPAFAHVPLILGPDKKNLSKRHGATSVIEYARQGYLPESMVNFLALLGWSPGTDRELFSRQELVEAFTLEGINRSGAVFNAEKLDWFNQQHIARLAPDELARRVRPLLERAGLWNPEYFGDRHAWFFSVIELLKPRARRLDDFVAQGRFFFTDDVTYDQAAVDKHVRSAGMEAPLALMDKELGELPTFDPASIEVAVRALAGRQDVKAASLIHALRVAVTGQAVSPGLFEVLALVGRERVRARLYATARLLSARHV